ncbi:MAG: helix-turn-helix domain-containing protein [Firmicutes bacterium]|nr:helix-turn-helix domain-containing protein [Bacillota bacterium]
MEFIRIGEKLINIHKIDVTIRRILKLRNEGMSQQEVAIKLQLDRTFISRLETLGNVRRGGRIGLMAFPVQNKEELLSLADRYGIEDRLILSEEERWQLVANKNGIDFLNQVIAIIEQFRQCDTVFVFCSAKWNRLAAALLDNEVVTVEIGHSPITKDVLVRINEVEATLNPFMGDEFGEGTL